MACVQARMGSTRLPRKVLKTIVGMPMLWHIIQRLKRSKLIDKIVIVTSIKKRDIPILKFAKNNGVDSYAGSEEDLVDRHFQAAKKFKADILVRITADCPLVDPEIVDKVIQFFLDGNFDYVSNIIERTYPDGLDVEVFSYSSLEKIWKEAKTPREREFFTVYMRDHPEIFQIGGIKQGEDISYMQWTVDTEKDLKFAREIYKRLYKKNKIFYMKDILSLLKKHPELTEINKGIAREESRLKSLKDLKE